MTSLETAMDTLRAIVENQPADRRFLPVDMELLRRVVAAPEPEAPQIKEPFTVSETQVTRLCTAYESGYGRGQSNRDLAQPYAAGCAEARAYYQGWLRGVQNREGSQK